MSKKVSRRRKRLKFIFLTVGIIAVIFLALNWFLSTRLENFLKKELSSRVSEATSGFYKLSFDKLSIGFFSGELKIENITFVPDSATFKQWAAIDSLPQNYLELHVASIHFEGLNLTWRINYSKLNFELFQIESPKIKITESLYSAHFRKDTKNKGSQDLYELISPYINVLTVKKLNVENASVSYKVENLSVDADYALTDVSFHAYGFRLDKDSHASGKLLYCNQFDFVTNQPQVLLTNQQFILNTDSIRLSTQDSTIQIRGIRLTAQDSLWKQDGRLPDTYLNALIEEVDVKGIYFKRENSLTYLDARSFEINSSEIEYFVTPKEDSDSANTTVNVIDSLSQSWTLYDIVSPVLHSFSVDDISINDAHFKYTEKRESGVDVFTLDKLNFGASGFLVDSLSGIQNRFMYSIDFLLDANIINGRMERFNHNVDIGHILLDTKTGIFKVENVSVSPISIDNKYDYLHGSIDSISIEGLDYQDGIKAKLFSIDSPDLRYVRKSGQLMGADKKGKTKSEEIEGANTLDLFYSTLKHLYIDNIYLNRADLKFDDYTTGERIPYRLKSFNFYATDFAMDESTRKSRYGFFDCSNFGFKFRDFDNYMFGKDYRLKIREALFTQRNGRFELKDVKLIPQTDKWKKSPDSYYALETPLFLMNGIDYVDKTAKIDNIVLESPRISVVKEREGQKHNVKKKTKDNESVLSFIGGLKVGSVNIDHIYAKYLDKTAADSLLLKTEDLKLKGISWNLASQNKLNLDEVYLKAPQIRVDKYRQPEVENKRKEKVSGLSNNFPVDMFTVGKVNVSDFALSSSTPGNKIDAGLKQLNLSDIIWKTKGEDSYFKLNEFLLSDPTVSVLSTQTHTADSLDADENSSENTDIYSILDGFAKHLSINKLNVSNANIDYVSGEKSPLITDKLNKTDLYLQGLDIYAPERKTKLDDIRFTTRNLRFPISNGFYTIKVDSVSINKKDPQIRIDRLHMEARYPKMEYAYKHPKNKDWFDLTMGSATVKGLDFDKYFSDNIVDIADFKVEDIVLQNFKNQQIEIEHNIMPLIYEGLQKAPVKLNVKNTDVRNFTVKYEELPKQGTIPGLILLSDINGHIDGLTNIVSRPGQYFDLDAEGMFMGTGYFTAKWRIPVDTLTDCFVLDAHLQKFDLGELNQLITPMAPAKIESGVLNDTKFKIEASSLEARVDMLFLYNDLKLNVLKSNDAAAEQNKFVTFLANRIIKADNPRKKNKKPQEVHLSITRDPYHSTFNYFWQALQPALVESVGFSQGKQNFGKKVMGVVNSVKNFFKPKKKDAEDK